MQEKSNQQIDSATVESANIDIPLYDTDDVLSNENASGLTSSKIAPISGFLGARETLASPTFHHTGTTEMTVTPEEWRQLQDFAKVTINEDFKKDQYIVSVLANQVKLKMQSDFVIIDFPYVKNLNAYQEWGDALNWDYLSSEERSRLTLCLEYLPVGGGEELYPCVAVHSLPIWEKLPFEPVDYYLVFQKYCDCGYSRTDSGTIMKTNRSMYYLANTLGMSQGHLTYLSKVFSWTSRIKAFDMYMQMLIQQRLQRQALLARDAQFSIGQTLIEKATSALNRMELSPKLALEALKLGVEYISVSSGILADKPDGYVNQRFSGGTSIGNNFQINNNNSSIQLNQVNTDKSQVELEMQSNLEDKGNVDQILNVLINSGALDVALNGEMVDESIIDMEEE